MKTNPNQMRAITAIMTQFLLDSDDTVGLIVTPSTGIASILHQMYAINLYVKQGSVDYLVDISERNGTRVHTLKGTSETDLVDQIIQTLDEWDMR